VLLEAFLRPMGVGQAAAAARMGVSLNRLNEIVRGRRGISADTAWRLSDLLDTSPQFWLNLQAAVDLYNARPAAGKPPEHSPSSSRASDAPVSC
jgi:addiction module HigA family antidote